MIARLLICIWVVVGVVGAESPERLIFFVMEGTSQRAIIGLKNKDKLPHLKWVYDEGNIRNMSVPLSRIQYESSMVPFIYKDDLVTNQISDKASVLWIEDLIKQSKKMKAFCVLSVTKNPEAQTSVSTLFPDPLPKRVDVKQLTDPSAMDVVQTAIQWLPKKPNPYVLWMNFTQVDDAGHRYREGSAKYSKAIREVDTALGYLFRHLKASDQWDRTRIIGVTNYGFDTKSQLYQTHSKAWIMANKKVMRKGTSWDVVPSILAEWGVSTNRTSLFAKTP